MTEQFPSVDVGFELPNHIQGPISRGTLALFAGASNDHVLLHIDSDYAKAAGMDDVFAHGMLSMAYLAQMLTQWAPQERLRQWGVRFKAVTPLYATVHCKGVVTSVFQEGGTRLARVRLSATTDKGVVTVEGHAVVALS